MAAEIKTPVNDQFAFSSCVASDIFHASKSRKGYEWWYFDALSDDGRDGVVIIFLDNFIFSPRYNAPENSKFRIRSLFRNSLNNSPATDEKVPAVAFVYYRDGKPQYRAINEFSEDAFFGDTENPECRIGNNHFKFESAPYGSGYTIQINAKLRKNRTIEAQFEWLSIESDFLPGKNSDLEKRHFWNLVAPRSDVSGRITVSGKNGNKLDVVHFRGTGYHDHNLDNRWLPSTVEDWQWGRAHFNDSTAVFYRYREIGSTNSVTKLMTVRNGELRERDAGLSEENYSRHIFGIKYPQRMTFITEDNMRLRIKQTRLIDASFFYLRFLSEMTLTLRDGKPRKTVGITEHLAPKALKLRWLDWLINMRIGKKGKGAFLP
ncbi:hydroxyneurosporene dehydrogenase [soil metagenome]